MSLTVEYDGQAHVTDPQFQEVLDSCGFSDEGQVKDLIAKTYTPHKFNEKVAEKHFKSCGNYDYFTNFFGTEVWQDGQGQDEFREIYYAPRIGYDFARFIRTMQICDPQSADECNLECDTLPEGARGALPPMEMYKWCVRTPRQCIANMRHIRDFQNWGKMLLKGWYSVDEQIMNMFFMFAAIRLAGHKIITQGQRDENGDVYPLPNSDPKNPFGMFLYNYQEPMFPQVWDADLIVPLEMQYLEAAARYFTHAGTDNHIGIGERGEKIYEFWYPEDWYRQYAIKNPEYFDALKHSMPAKLLSGYSTSNLKSGKQEVLGNWSMKVMPCLPRFAESTDGGLIPIDNFVHEQVEVGERPVFGGRDYLNAPFLMAIMPSPNAGTIMYRPDLTTSVEGWPIMPIMGRGGWTIRNDYDAECNEDMNMPYAKRRYEIGFRLDDPDASMAVIFRNTVFRIKAANECDWATVTPKTPPDNFSANPMGVSCDTNARRAPQSVSETGVDGDVYVECDSVVCGDANSLIHRVKYTRKAYNKDYLPFFNCTCGDTVEVVIVDADGIDRTETATILDSSAMFAQNNQWPDAHLWLQLGQALAAGECIKYIVCPNDDITFEGGIVVKTIAQEAGDLRLILAGHTTCEAADSGVIKYYDKDGVQIGADVVATVTSLVASDNILVDTLVNPDTFIEATVTTWTCTTNPE